MAVSGAAVPRLRQTWETLAVDARSIFATPLWAETWWLHLGPSGDMPLPIAVRDADANLAALVPLYLVAAQTRACAATDRPWAGRSARSYLRCRPRARRRPDPAPSARQPGLGHLRRGNAPCRPYLGNAFSVQLAERTGSPAIPLAGRSWDDVLADMSSNARQQARRRERTPPFLRRQVQVGNRSTAPRRRLSGVVQAASPTLGRWHDRLRRQRRSVPPSLFS